MSTLAFHRNHLAEILSSLSVDDMTWAMKFLADKLMSRLKVHHAVSDAEVLALERAKTERFLSKVCGKWKDDKDADEMVNDIYASRVNKDFSELEKIFNE